MAIIRVKTRWTVPGAGTAFTVMHFAPDSADFPDPEDVDSITARVRTFWDTIKAHIPNGVFMDVLNDGEVIDNQTGNLLGVVSGATVAQVAGAASSAATWAAPAGACITWSTDGLRTVSSKPRRVRGRTFIVPLSSGAYQNDGTLSAGCMTSLNTAALALRSNFATRGFGIYGRPGPDAQPGGTFHLVTGHRITDQAAILRSRRS